MRLPFKKRIFGVPFFSSLSLIISLSLGHLRAKVIWFQHISSNNDTLLLVCSITISVTQFNPTKLNEQAMEREEKVKDRKK